ncbi:MAG TPA: hypothetical protein VGX78_03050, partial [Pirellulales bacterium]|nr:hypothetical protein [Pirellulales bacterium]
MSKAELATERCLSGPETAGRSPAAGLTVRRACLAIALLGTVAFANGVRGAFYLDDFVTIVNNPTLRHLWPLTAVLSPPNGCTAAGRPLLNLSFAINYAVGKTEPLGFHLVNIALHVLAALVLFGVVRRTLLLRSFVVDRAMRLAMLVTMLWVVHPLQTESVTYIVQRAESLAGLLYLLTFYCVIRGATLERRDKALRWYLLAVISCAAGMASKEVMATAPVLLA